MTDFCVRFSFLSFTDRHSISRFKSHAACICTANFAESLQTISSWLLALDSCISFLVSCILYPESFPESCCIFYSSLPLPLPYLLGWLNTEYIYHQRLRSRFVSWPG